MILLEKTRNQLVSKSRQGKKERDGKTRYQKRLKCRVRNSVKELNRIDMNKFFKDNILDVSLIVQGETDDYLVKISFGGILDDLQRFLKDKEQVELGDIVRALTSAFNKDNVYINCHCEDFVYRFAYWSTKGDFNSGKPELRPAKITNPNDDLGDGCKHILAVLSNTNWIIKVASVINNYIKYIKDRMQKAYADIVYPAVYGREYKEPVQLGLLDKDELDTDEETIDKSNISARQRGQFKQGNEYRFQKQDKNDTIPLDIEGEQENVEENQ